VTRARLPLFAACLLTLPAAACDPGALPDITPCLDDGEAVVSAPGVVVPDEFFSFEVVAGGPLTRITGLALGPGGELYVSDIGETNVNGDEGIYVVDPATGSVTPILTGAPLGAPGRLTLSDGRDPFGDRLVVADWNTEETAPCCGGRVFAIDVETGEWETISMGSPSLTTGDPFGLALASGGFEGSAYVMDFQGASSQEPVLFRIDADGSAHDVVVDPSQWTTTQAPRDVTFGRGAGFFGMYIADGSPGAIWRVDGDLQLSNVLAGPPAGGSPAAIEQGLGGAFGREMYMLDAATKDLRTFTPDGAVTVFGSVADADGFADMVFAPGCGTLYIGTGDRIVAIRPL